MNTKTIDGLTPLDYIADIHDMMGDCMEQDNGHEAPEMVIPIPTYHKIMDTIEVALGKYVVGGVK